MGDWDHNNLVHELRQGMELATQLQISLQVPSTSPQSRELLNEKIIAAFEKALAMVNWNGVQVGEPSQMPTRVAMRMSQSPPLSASPRSEDSDRDLEQSATRKRKVMPRWTKHIRVNPGMEVEGSLDDGYCWRKYGQKDILGAKYPRGYYRCTHRNVQGCMATKQVQRSDEDPNIFEITYREKHNCTMSSYVVPPSGPQENQESNLSKVPQHQNDQQILEQHSSDHLVLNLREGLKILTENLHHAPDQVTSTLHFPSTTNIKTEDKVFPSPMIENNTAENFIYPSYVSPATSRTSYFSVSPSGGNSFVGYSNLLSSGSEINDMIIAATSAANSPTVDLEFPFDQFQLDGQNFTFDNPPFS
ncbi:probable WRKY transcription factor 30 [Gastrolobium bilobum]|uniref:probable WRKY transcription factor 30 n=1 Tax=Gastrolobium bilobum TaxID=150636 RepID=UPI002AB0F1A8|nr:probable WRKY transcription factor 30 [Gastrolobium bilobum]